MTRENISEAINELKVLLYNRFAGAVEIYLFGSVARNDYQPDSDIDILVLIPGKVNRKLEEEVIDLSYDVELKYDVVFGVVVYSREFWSSPKAAVMPFHQNVQREGVRV